jgi:hypothetical protein
MWRYRQSCPTSTIIRDLNAFRFDRRSIYFTRDKTSLGLNSYQPDVFGPRVIRAFVIPLGEKTLDQLVRKIAHL